MPRPTPSSACDFFELRQDGSSPDDWAYRAGIALLSTSFDSAVSDILKIVATAAHADRAWFFIYNDDATEFRNTHEWCRPGVSSFLSELQYSPVSMIGWLHTHLLKNRAVMIHDIHRLPKSARALRIELLRQNDQSVLSVPIFREGRIYGCIGFDAVTQPRVWTDDIVRSLQRCGELIATASQPPAGPTTPAPAAPPSSLYLPATQGVRRVALDTIAGVRAERDYTRIHLRDGHSYLELRPLAEWVSLLPSDRFQRIHRSALVRVASVLEVERTASGHWLARLDGISEKWSVSKRYRPALRSRLGV